MQSGRLVVISISNTPSSPTDSTAVPVSVRSSASLRSSTFRSTNSRIHVGEIFIRLSALGSWPLAQSRPLERGSFVNRQSAIVNLSELFQKPHIPLEQQLNVVNAVAQH